MMTARPVLTLAHSGDPDDVFMWWPLTGKVLPDGKIIPGRNAEARIDTGRFKFRAVPGDISVFNRRASAEAPYDITALSVRAFADVTDRYVLTRCGGSFGEGYGPKVVCLAQNKNIRCEGCLSKESVRIAVPGLRTSAFLALGLLLGPDAMRNGARFVEMPFDRIIPAVVRGEADAGLVIHEGQVSFQDVGLREVIDLGAWWKETRALPLPLGVNAIKRDLADRFGPGTLAEVSGLLSSSLRFALKNFDESIDVTMPFARANAQTSGTRPPPRERVEHYVRMYVTERTTDMGDAGRHSIITLLEQGAGAGLCPAPSRVEVV